MKRINIEVLEPGDIVLVTSRNKKPSGLIRAVTNSDISHAMLAVEKHSIIDATSEGVQARNPQKMFYEDDLPIYILRSKIELTNNELAEIINFSRSIIGTPYTTIEAINGHFKIPVPENKKMFCSRLAATAYERAGISLVNNPGYCTPEDLKQSKDLFMVENPDELVSNTEVEYWENQPDHAHAMRVSTLQVLSEVRQINSNIYSMNDLDYFLIENPEYDNRIYQIIRNSGYLTLWKVEWLDNSNQYTVEGVLNLSDPTGYCYNVLSEDNSRFHQNKSVYKKYYKRYKLKTFKALRELYDALENKHSIRLNVAHKALSIITKGK